MKKQLSQGRRIVEGKDSVKKIWWTPKKMCKNTPKPCPRHHLEPKNNADAAGARKKAILGGRVPHRACQKDRKVDLQTGPRAPKSKIYVLHQKTIICGVSLEAREAAFGG